MSDPSAQERRDLLARMPLFSTLEPSELDDLLQVVRPRRFKAREEVFHKGDEGQQVFAILKGRLKVVTTSREGDDVVFGILGPGEVFGELAVLAGGVRSATITAIDACEVLVLHRRDFVPFLERHPGVSIKLLQLLAERLRRIDEFIEDTLFLNLPTRLAKKLLALSSSYGQPTPEGTRINLKLSQEELGDLVGTTRESINRQLRAWQDQGFVANHRGYVTILRPDALEALAGIVVD